MQRLSHYFTPFQIYVIEEAESDRGRFDMRVAVEILRHESAYCAGRTGSAGIVHVSV